MGYHGNSLETLFDDSAQDELKVTLRRGADRAGSRMRELARINTPVNTGELRMSWYQLPTEKIRHLLTPSDYAYRSGTATDVDYAPYVEFGTGLYGPRHAKYAILPKNAPMLAWKDPKTGHWIYAKKVMHPGSPGNHMVAIAADVVEHEFEHGLIDDLLAEWTNGIERRAEAKIE
jgi:hypothetical protein